ncbi:hypothetical protein [Pseudonocardia hierapolitana]|uniref:hypothetical protein n=1 Tax=Pseudonocardia hierapolitana TaxID=1128676 RepID=UPI001478DCDB|nr:hypothetical protein [Pseudonocardia hierapolitana]
MIDSSMIRRPRMSMIAPTVSVPTRAYLPIAPACSGVTPFPAGEHRRDRGAVDDQVIPVEHDADEADQDDEGEAAARRRRLFGGERRR